MGETDIEVGEGTALLSQSWAGDVPLKDLKAATLKERAVAAAAVVGCTFLLWRQGFGRCCCFVVVDPPR